LIHLYSKIKELLKSKKKYICFVGTNAGAFTVKIEASIKEIAVSIGIGLSMVKKIIGFHSGEIWAESDGKSGSKINLTLPK